YTAITRCKKSLILCGEKDAFFKGIRTLDTNKRYTTLKQLLQAKMNDETIESENKVADGELPTLNQKQKKQTSHRLISCNAYFLLLIGQNKTGGFFMNQNNKLLRSMITIILL